MQADEYEDLVAFRSAPQDDPPPVRQIATQEEVNAQMQQQYYNLSLRIDKLTEDLNERSRLTLEERLAKVEKKLDGPETIEQLQQKRDEINYEDTRKVIQAEYDENYRREMNTYREIEGMGPKYRSQNDKTETEELKERIEVLEQIIRDAFPHRLDLQSDKRQRTSTAPESVVDSVFSKFYQTGRHF